MANTIDSQVGGAVGNDDVQLYNNDFSVGAGNAIDITSKNDGTDSTVRLQAGGGVNVPGVVFQVKQSASAIWSDIATVSARNDDGSFFHEWTPADNGVFAGDTIDLRVVNTADFGETDTETTINVRNASAITTQAINIATGEQKGYFFDPDDGTPFPNTEASLGVTGTTTVLSTLGIDSPGIAWMDGGGNEEDFTFDTSNDGAGGWEGVLELDPYPFDDPDLPPAEADQLVVRAVTDTVSIADDPSDDFEAFTLYEQTLTSVTCTITPQTEPDPGIITVTVLDQNSQPIAGIDVYEDNGDALGETDGRGQVTTLEADDLQFFYANADSPNAFSPGAGDKRSPDCNNQAAVVDIATAPSDGDVPIGTTVTETITVTDTNGDPISNRDVRIIRNGPADDGETVFKTTNDAGQLTYEFTCSVEGVAQLEVGIEGPVAPLADPFTFAIANDTVNCKNPPEPRPINAKLKGKSSQGRDVLRVNAPSDAAGATVRLQARVDGEWTTLKTKTLDGAGDRKIGVKDRNGKKVTKYRAKVGGTALTLPDTTPFKRLR